MWLDLLGLKKGDVLIVHSSLSSFGLVDGALKPLSTPFLKQLDWRYPGSLQKKKNALRSLNPTHSIAAIGAKAKEIVDAAKESADEGFKKFSNMTVMFF